jgi:hypothetical protein
MPNFSSDQYVKLCYEIIRIYDNMGYHNWATDVRVHFFSNGYGDVWEDQSNNNPKLFFVTIYLKIKGLICTRMER